MLEEFGKLVDEDDGIALRDRYFQAAYDVAEAYALNDGIVQGTVRALLVPVQCIDSECSPPVSVRATSVLRVHDVVQRSFSGTGMMLASGQAAMDFGLQTQPSTSYESTPPA